MTTQKTMESSGLQIRKVHIIYPCYYYAHGSITFQPSYFEACFFNFPYKDICLFEFRLNNTIETKKALSVKTDYK